MQKGLTKPREFVICHLAFQRKVNLLFYLQILSLICLLLGFSVCWGEQYFFISCCHEKYLTVFGVCKMNLEGLGNRVEVCMPRARKAVESSVTKKLGFRFLKRVVKLGIKLRILFCSFMTAKVELQGQVIMRRLYLIQQHQCLHCIE